MINFYSRYLRIFLTIGSCVLIICVELIEIKVVVHDLFDIRILTVSAHDTTSVPLHSSKTGDLGNPSCCRHLTHSGHPSLDLTHPFEFLVPGRSPNLLIRLAPLLLVLPSCLHVAALILVLSIRTVLYVLVIPHGCPLIFGFGVIQRIVKANLSLVLDQIFIRNVRQFIDTLFLARGLLLRGLVLISQILVVRVVFALVVFIVVSRFFHLLVCFFDGVWVMDRESFARH